MAQQKEVVANHMGRISPAFKLGTLLETTMECTVCEQMLSLVCFAPRDQVVGNNGGAAAAGGGGRKASSSSSSAKKRKRSGTGRRCRMCGYRGQRFGKLTVEAAVELKRLCIERADALKVDVKLHKARFWGVCDGEGDVEEGDEPEEGEGEGEWGGHTPRRSEPVQGRGGSNGGRGRRQSSSKGTAPKPPKRVRAAGGAAGRRVRAARLEAEVRDAEMSEATQDAEDTQGVAGDGGDAETEKSGAKRRRTKSEKKALAGKSEVKSEASSEWTVVAAAGDALEEKESGEGQVGARNAGEESEGKEQSDSSASPSPNRTPVRGEGSQQQGQGQAVEVGAGQEEEDVDLPQGMDVVVEEAASLSSLSSPSSPSSPSSLASLASPSVFNSRKKEAAAADTQDDDRCRTPTPSTTGGDAASYGVPGHGYLHGHPDLLHCSTSPVKDQPRSRSNSTSVAVTEGGGSGGSGVGSSLSSGVCSAFSEDPAFHKKACPLCGAFSAPADGMCMSCSFNFRARSDLVKAKGRHACDQCAKTFAGKSGLWYHKRHSHGAAASPSSPTPSSPIATLRQPQVQVDFPIA